MQLAIKTNDALNIANVFGEQCGKLNAYREQVQNVKRSCPGSGDARSSLLSALGNILDEMEKEKRIYSNMKEMIGNAVSCYRTYEESIAKCDSSSTATWGEDEEQEGDDTGAGNSIWSWGDTWNIIGNFGVVGAGVSVLGNLISGGINAGNLLSSAGFVNTAIGSGAAAWSAKAGSDAKWWKQLVGFETASELELCNGKFLDNFKKVWNKQFIDDLGFGNTPPSTTADKVQVGTKWAGHVLTLAGNAVENYGEFEGQGTYGVVRGTTETVIETGVDIAIGAAATALSATVIAAAGFVSAPAVVVGAAAVGVTWAANAVCKWATGGKDIGEFTADLLCDVGEGAINLAKKGVEKVGEIGTNIGKGISKGIDKAKQGLSSAWKGICGVFG